MRILTTLNRATWLTLLAIFILIAIFYTWLVGFKPSYNGEVQLPGLEQPSEILFDEHGVPHIYAENEEDAYYTLGFVHAKERLFQMEMMRRVSYGKLSEILGEKFLKTDLFFRTLGIKALAEKSAKTYLSSKQEDYQRAAKAYLKGINHFIATEKLPLEFLLMDIEAQPFVEEDVYALVGYMAFSFAAGFRIDPVMNYVHYGLGEAYSDAFALSPSEDYHHIPVSPSLRAPKVDSSLLKVATDFLDLAAKSDQIMQNLPVNIWLGSNAWAMSPKKSKSGSALLANDTHIKYSQPSVWYESHIHYPGFDFYGNFLCGFPFALIGHNSKAGWGLTMFENEDVDFFIEKLDPNNTQNYVYGDTLLPFESRIEKIAVKGKDTPESYEIKSTVHGPLVNQVIDLKNVDNPVSVWWTFTKFTSRVVQASYYLSHSTRVEEAQKAGSLIDAPGLNLTFANASGDIAWWAVGKILDYKDSIQPMYFIPGYTAKHEYLPFRDFSKNPQNINPEAGYLINANNQPEAIEGKLIPGYYAPKNRAERIQKLIESQDKWSQEEMKHISTDITSDEFAKLSNFLVKLILDANKQAKHPLAGEALRLLQNWDGTHGKESLEPTVFYAFLHYIFKLSMIDELGNASFKTLLNSHLMKNSYLKFIESEKSPWWDNINSPETETRIDILLTALDSSLSINEEILGSDLAQWQWRKKHTLTHEHPVGRQKPLDKIFNVGPLEASGGIETVNNFAFNLSDVAHHPIKYGPAMRILIDFSQVEKSESVLPTGQSGMFLSPFYKDQAQDYVDGNFRNQWMARADIDSVKTGTIRCTP